MNTKQDVISRFCALASEVGEEVFLHKYAHDCFCGNNKTFENDFRFDDIVLEFIEDAVRAKIACMKNRKDGYE